MKNFTKKILLCSKILILSLLIGGFIENVSAQWTSTSPWYSSPYPWTALTFPHLFSPPYPQAEIINLPLNVSSAPQIKDGPLHLNIDALISNFALTIPSKGMLIGNLNPSTIQSTRGILHIYNGAGGGTVNTTLSFPPAIRVDEQGIAFVTDSPDARIGIGTLTPQYSIDIPQGNPVVRIGGDLPVPAGVSLQTLGRVKIMGGNPFPGAFLSALDFEGEAIWVTPVCTGSSQNNCPYTKAYVEVSDLTGFVTTQGPSNPLSQLQRGLWQVTVWGTTGNTCESCSYTTRIRMFWDGATENPFNEEISFVTRNNPDGTTPFSVTRIIRVWNTQFNVAVSAVGNPNPTSVPLINGITAVWLGQ